MKSTFTHPTLKINYIISALLGMLLLSITLHAGNDSTDIGLSKNAMLHESQEGITGQGPAKKANDETWLGLKPRDREWLLPVAASLLSVFLTFWLTQWNDRRRNLKADAGHLDDIRKLERLVGEKDGEIKMLRTELVKKETELDRLMKQNNAANTPRIEELQAEVDRLKKEIVEKVDERDDVEVNLKKARLSLPKFGTKNKLRNQAMMAASNEKYDDAIALYKQAAQQSFDESALAFYNIGQLQEFKNDPVQADFNHSMAAHIAPDNLRYLEAAIDSSFDTLNNEKVISFVNQVLAIYKSSKADKSKEVSRMKRKLIAANLNLAKWSEVERLIKEEEEFHRSAGTVNGREYACILSIKAEFYFEKSLYDEALELCEKARTIFSKIPDIKPLDMAAVNWVVGIIYAKINAHEKALGFYQLALEVYEKEEGKYSSSTLDLMTNIGSQWGDLEDYDKAHFYLSTVLEVEIKKFGKDHPSIFETYGQMGHLYREEENYTDALFYFEKALALCRKAFGNNHPDNAFYLEGIGYVQFEIKNYESAASNFEEAHLLFKNSLGSAHFHTSHGLYWIGLCKLEMKNYDAAIRCFEEAYPNLTRALKKENTIRIECKEALERAQREYQTLK